eukprot:TRINITY_DN6169_c0_g1_i1.p1 TRINITY_DN6169_c0_g1~~TRINITY_DN6169_c0_g1_i1.p1  ORF type:complete len:346 (+),score=46.84 TRINITY_DN6169_c0_g1_i1:69-1106(+)
MAVPLGTVARLVVVLVATLSRASCMQQSATRSVRGERTNASVATDDEVCDVVGMLWQRAAEIFQVNHVTDCAMLRKFYSVSPASMEGWQIGGKEINYMPIWKNANNAIRCNMDAAAQASGGSYILGAPAFTFVRDPLSHFVSAFSEINFRLANCDVGGEFQTYPMESTERARTFLSDLVGFRLNFDCQVNCHIFSQRGPLSSVPVPLNYIGRLENFEADWRVVGGLLGQRMPAFDSACGAHESTDASSGFPPRDAMDSALGGDLPSQLSGSGSASSRLSISSSMRQLLDGGGVAAVLACSVLLPDYVCLQYELPVTDRECVEAGFATSVDAWRLKIHDVRTKICP